MKPRSTNIDKLEIPDHKTRRKLTKEDYKLYGDIGLAVLSVGAGIGAIYYIGKVGIALMKQSAADVKEKEYDRPFDLKSHKSDLIKAGIGLAVTVALGFYFKHQMKKGDI